MKSYRNTSQQEQENRMILRRLFIIFIVLLIVITCILIADAMRIYDLYYWNFEGGKLSAYFSILGHVITIGGGMK